MTDNRLIVGSSHDIKYPFVMERVSLWDGEASYEADSWRPGIRTELMPPEGEPAHFADGEGKQILTIVDIHKPGRFPERIFYTRQWQDPAGKVFGKPKLFIAVASKFNRLRRGYMHEYTIETKSMAQQCAEIRAEIGGYV